MKPARHLQRVVTSILICSVAYFSYGQTPQCLNHDEDIRLPGGTGTMQLYAGDFNNDGASEVLAYFTTNKTIIIYNGSIHGLEKFAEWHIPDLQSISVPGDINGDSFDDIVITARDTAFFYTGSAQGPAINDELIIPINDLFDEPKNILSSRVYKIGDVNKDSIDDFFLEPRISDPDATVLFLMLGSRDSIRNVSADYSYNVSGNYPYYASIYPVGDINGDGFIDLIKQDEYSRYLHYGGTLDFFKGPGVELENEGASWWPLGDINGDGYDDFMRSYPSGRDNQPLVWLYCGSPNGPTGPISWKPDVLFTPETNEEEYGALAGAVGDINHDGYDDFFIHGGSNNYTVIYYGSADLPKVSGDLKLPRNLTGFTPGQDVNADGFDDLLSIFTSQNQANLWVYHGSAQGLKGITTCPSMGEKPDIVLGGVLAESAGDVNGDGNEDILIGFPEYYGDWEFNSGAITVHLGSPSGTKPDYMGWGIWNEEFGAIISSGDYNGDGFGDVAAGHETYKRMGGIYFFYGSASGIDNQPRWILEGNDDIGIVGTNIISGNFNGDAFDDFILVRQDGTIVIYYGMANFPIIGFNSSIKGMAALKAGDVNDDGFDDFFVKRSDGYHLYWGGPTQPIESDYSGPLIPRDIGDLNNDGFDDIVLYNE